MFTRLGEAIARRPKITAVSWLVATAALLLLALTGVAGQGLFDRLHSGEPKVPGSESDIGQELLAEHATSSETLTLLTWDVDLSDPAELAGPIGVFHTKVFSLEDVVGVVDPFVFPDGLEDPRAAALVSADGFLASVSLAPDLSSAEQAAAHDEVVAEMDGLLEDLGAQGIVSSESIMVEDIIGQLQQDLQTGEAVALPISLVIMVIVFGGFLAAGMPLLGALASIAGGLGALWGFSYVLELDSVVVNVVTVLGLGLSIDYGLLFVSRYRQELRAAIAGEDGRRRRRQDPAVSAAIAATMATAGRTVTFSAITVAISIAGLMLLSPEILRSLGAAGVSVVLIAVLSSLTLVPAVLTLLGRRMARPSALTRVPGLGAALGRFGDVPPPTGVFSRLAGLVQRRPWWTLGIVTVVLAVLAAPTLSMEMRNSTTELLPSDSSQREFIDRIEADFPAAASPQLTVVAEAPIAADLAREIGGIAHVTRVGEPADLGEGYATIGVHLDVTDAGGDEASDVVRTIRDLREGPVPASAGEFWVVGQAANQIDFNAALADGLPWAVGIVVLATFLLLFLMTGSLLVPVKALAINVLSLGASLGITSWIFAEGHLESLLGFTSAGGLESYVVAVVVAFGFGLAMDYEVFLLAGIKELHDAGADNDTAVRDGLQRTGRIITSAALVIMVVFAGFAFGDLLAIKEVGIALAVTVLVDATLVRMLLVPATMTLLGEWNWWAPAPLRRLHARIGLHH
ncbi:MMPL family transporter [Pseudactinotalea sp. HY158]|uniref:MMPL family transporter n=1 Tax=Pseudactinotalea sp. HY158 TaxID=2654547 RepID=UPI00129C9A88|nr:MMPL family transporter [Pseudactinotalea sp. HY158]QGH69350.1 MMPL family transporter [Pseudactinotalea sp. HY158]